MSILEAKQVSVRIGSVEPLKPTNLLLRTGELTAILGPNGAGKSTLVKALLGLVASSGTVLFDKKPIAAFSASEGARHIAYLPQGQSHAWPLAVEAVVALGRYPHGGRDDGTVGRVLDSLGLATLSKRSVLTLSGGEQMRVSLARALAVQATFLLADEPLASLDPRYQFEIMTVLAAQAELGQGIVVVMHDLALAARYADRLILIKDGAILADGPPQAVLTGENVRSVFNVHARDTEVHRKDGPISVALPDRLEPEASVA
jgi:iron complex transport system ATP-binding protein